MPSDAAQQQGLRTVLVTNGNLLSMISLGEFLRRYHGHVAAVFLTTRLPSQKSNIRGVLSMLRHSGWGYTHFKLLTNVLLPRRLRRQGLPANVAECLQRCGADTEVIPAENVNRAEVVEQVRRFAPEILLSFSATSRFKNKLLRVPTRLAMNVHYALLPEYAGLSPYFWYLRNNESEAGVTFHQIVPKLDAGPIIEQERFSNTDTRTVLGLLRKQMACVSPMLLRFYAGETSEHDTTPQDMSRRTYFQHPTRADVRALRANGYKFFERNDITGIEEAVRRLAAATG